MSPGKIFLVIIASSISFVLKAQDQARSIPAITKISRLTTKDQRSSKSIEEQKDYSKPIRNAEPRCSCNVSPQIVPVSRTGTTWTYQGIPNASCSGAILTSPDKSEDTCGVKNVTYSWSIVSGSEIAEINGSNSNSTVNINIKGTGSFTINLVNTVTCSDSSSCSNYTYYTDSAHVDSSHCTCTAGPVTIAPTNRQGNTWSYQGTVQGNCTGQYGVSPNLQPCNVQNTQYQWSISGSGASIMGSNSNSTVNVQVSNNAKFSLRLDGTTICSDGKPCMNYNFYEDSVKNDTPRNCQCNVALARIDPITRQDSTFSYKATVVGSCTGVHGIEPNVDSCSVQNISYEWFISAGTANAEIIGATNGPTVVVHIKKKGAFTLDVMGEVTCSDSSKCHYVTYIDDSLRTNKCELSYTEDVLPKMNGGLRKFYGANNGRMARDEFLMLEAEGKDIDKVVLSCTPASGCQDTKSNRTILLNGRVRFEWKIEGEEGNFVKLGCLPDALKKDEGEHVIFQPPFVPLPVKADDTSATVDITLSIIDDNPTQPLDERVDRKITITVKRFKNSPDEYGIEVKSDQYELPKPDVATQDIGTCKAVHSWEMNTNLKTPEIELANVPDKDKLVTGEWMVLKAVDQRDPDRLKMVCQGTKCDNDGNEKVYEDNVQWTWTVLKNGDMRNNGKILGQDKGRFVVYEAPDKLPKDSSFITVTIQVTVENSAELPKIGDGSFTKQFRLLVYQGGIKMEYPALEWLPTEDGSVKVKSSLAYLDGRTWKPSLAHQCKIHFFEMKDISREPGVCMNEPTPDKADDCFDLYLKSETEHEAFNDTKGGNKCSIASLFQEARTKKPVREYSITVYSRDFGAYGFLLSKTKKPTYVSVPVLASDVKHPDGNRAKKKVYNDNRINLPKDIDENKIADWGWDSPAGHIADPIDKKGDDDPTPTGDGFNGDGFTNYEEYRGFRVQGGEGLAHIRTSNNLKDLFVRNKDVFKLDLFKTQSGLQVHEITPEQYISDDKRIVNFNNSKDVHQNDQMGIYLHSAPDQGNLLGIAVTQDGQPAPPNAVKEVKIMLGKIHKFCQDRKMTAGEEEAKIQQIVAHELAHACNVYHHGEGDPAVENDFNKLHGLRSGNMDCIMRYDNIEANHKEKFGSIFCTSPDATDSNAFLEANTKTCRGNCAAQFRVSGKVNNYPKRVTQQDCKKLTK